MKKNGKYRFSLQFPAVTDQQITVGDTLEKMGNRKSVIIVNAVFQYIANNPDLFFADYPHSLQKTNNNPISKDPIWYYALGKKSSRRFAGRRLGAGRLRRCSMLMLGNKGESPAGRLLEVGK